MNYTPPPNIGLTPIYIDEYLLAVDKPAELLSVPGRGDDKQDCMARRVQAEYPDAMVVHRLDMATSGLMLMARNPDIHSQLGKMFEKRQVDKLYVAIVDGQLENDEGEIDLPLITDWPNRPRQKIDYESGKPALTRYRLIDYNPDQNSSRVELLPHTGRTHQLRVHMQAIGHPIIGDRLYADPSALKKSHRLALHSEYIGLTHPKTRERLELHVTSPF